MGAYRLEVSPNNRAACNGMQPCKGTKITKGECRFGTWVEIKDHGSFKWRHLACVTKKVFANLKNDFNSPEDVDGFDELPEAYQQKFSEYFETGIVPEEDLPESARKKDEADGEPGEDAGDEGKKKITKKGKEAAPTENGDKPAAKSAPKKRKAPAKKAKTEESDQEEEEALTTEDEKPSKKRKTANKKSVKEESDNENEEDAAPAKKTKTAAKAKPAKKSAKKVDPDSELSASD
ncbi:hypothetical protein NCC49_005518 [Naganishia albida]|nr:hypothetical protein NCC49_005518 [Naganishia albida]